MASTATPHPTSKPRIGTAERLAAYIVAVFCLLTMIMDSPVQMAIAP
jgi:hypothetical protein